MKRSLAAALFLPMVGWSGSAIACDNGPFPVTFERNTSVFTDQGEGSLAAAAAIFRHNRRGTLRLVLINSSKAETLLWEQRVKRAINYLEKYRVPAKSLELVRRNTRMVSDYRHGQTTMLTVELVAQCDKA
jgi:hypothetical protein